MSVSTDGQICYGVLLDDSAEYPWAEYDDFEEWWYVASGFVPSFYPYDEDGKELPQATDELIEDYWEERRNWSKEHRCPVELVNYCSADYPMYMLAVSDSVVEAHRGNPVRLDPDVLLDEERVGDWGALLSSFCRKYSVPYSLPPQWYLSSYWG